MPFCKTVRWKPAKVVEPFGVFADGVVEYIVPVDLGKTSPSFVFAADRIIVVISVENFFVLYNPFAVLFVEKETNGNSFI